MKIVSVLIVPLAVAAVAACSLGASAMAFSPNTSVRVMSYNIRVDVAADVPPWSERRSHMADQIAFFDPDLLGVQEAQPAMVADLSRALPIYDHYGVGRDDGAGGGETTTLFWRRARFERLGAETLWCSPTPHVPSKGWDAALNRTITRLVLLDRADGRLLDVRNTHFDHVGVVAREECAALVADLPAAQARGQTAEVILMGDFNVGPDSAPYRRILASGLRDARRLSPVTFGPAGTYNAFDITQDNDGVAIDHVFVGPGLSVSRFGVPTDSFAGKVISDHFPLVTDLVRGLDQAAP